MSDLRLSARCEDCGYWISGTSALDWIGEHLDIDPDHHVRVTRSGDIQGPHNPTPSDREERR